MEGYAASPIDEVQERDLLRPVMGLIGRLQELPPEAPEVKLQALMLLGRVLILRTVRASTMRVMEWPELKPEQINK